MSENLSEIPKEDKAEFEQLYDTLAEKVEELENGGQNFSQMMETYRVAANSLIGCYEILRDSENEVIQLNERIEELSRECGEMQ
ncbi:MAG: hypothetical protein IJV39_04380 [Ruminococcus sp.]|nr:hypothetical protein [Ruminococcus sp.]